MRRHAALLCEVHGERHGCSDFRKHVAWYLKGFAVGSELRRALAMVSSLAELDELLGPHPRPAVPGRRPRAAARPDHPPRPVALPDGWLDDRRRPAGRPAGAELEVSGG